ncbi:DUF5305 family protein [Halomarina oriensis]|uniref:DUF5305 domain-containing protein n=1 Tax=Halomarina oriensis TaxID=671145 RepID=A0A6B0GK37_9EURY|nr:DUF5305 family protein [Halomarina oriensis]MWG33163.1 hypothetical protein [Halomarina oriensis]
MTPGISKLRLLLADYDREVAAVLVVVGVLAFVAAGSLVLAPGTTVVTEQRDAQQVGAVVNTSAVVTGDSTVWESGTELHDEPMYLVEASPNLTLSATSSSPDANADVDQRLELVYRVVRDEEVVWERSETLAHREATGTDGLTTEATVNASAVSQRLDVIQEEFGRAGRAEARVRLNVSYDTGTYADSQTADAQLAFEGRGYSLDELSADETHTTPVTVEEREPPNWPSVAGLSLLGLWAVAGAAVLVTREREFDQQAARVELLYDRHREWISEAKLSEIDQTANRVVHVASLTDLVDLAIDSEKRVLHDSEQRLYAVFDEETSYYFRVPTQVDATLSSDDTEQGTKPSVSPGGD